VVDIDSGPGSSAPRKRADSRRNLAALLDAAAAAFTTWGVDAPVRDIAAKAGVGVGTLYRHFPTRADLIVAVYRHQVEACAEAGQTLLGDSSTPHAALARWINLFVDFLVTVCAQLLNAAGTAGEILPETDAYELMRGVGNLCIGADNNPRYHARRMVDLLIAGLRLR